MEDGNILINAIIGFLGTAFGALSTHFLHYRNKKTEEQKIINESIHYLLEVFHLLNRLNVEKMTAVYFDYFFLKVKGLLLELDENIKLNEEIIAAIRGLCLQTIRNTIVPKILKQTFDDLNNLGNKYENMVEKLATILPINAYHQRDKNKLEKLLKMTSLYFENVKKINVGDGDVVKETVSQIQPSLTMDIVDEYKSDLKKELFALLKKTTRHNRRAGEETIKKMESFVVTENDKRSMDLVIDGIMNQINQMSKMGIV